MQTRRYAMLALLTTALASGTWAETRKQCIKKAKSERSEAMKACMAKTGKEKTTCEKEARTSYKTAKTECKALPKKS